MTGTSAVTIAMRTLYQFRAALRVAIEALDAFQPEDLRPVGKKPDAFEKVVGHHRHHHVELEISVGAAQVIAVSLPMTCAQTCMSIRS